MSNYFIQILNMSITATYVAIIVMLARLFLKKSPKIFSYLLWLIVLFRLVCPFSIESSLSLIPDNSEVISYNNTLSQSEGSVNDVETNYSNFSPSFLSPDSNRENNNSGIVIKVLSVIWAFGVITFLIYGVLSFVKIKLKLSTATLIKDNIFETDRIETAFVFGFVKPRIYIPVNLSECERDYIIRHEKIHIKRYDHITKIIAYLALAIHWFNPVIWISYFLMVRDMEMSCDESVIKHMEMNIRRNYSNSLLSLSLKQSGLISPIHFGDSNVKLRIKNILNYQKPSFWIVAVAALIIILLSLFFVTNPRENDQELVGKKVVNEMPDRDIMAYIEDCDVNSGKLSFKEIEWIDETDVERIDELGLDLKWDFPNGYYIYDEHTDKHSLKLSDDVEIYVIDWSDLSHISTDINGFIEYAEQYDLFLDNKRGAIFNLTIENGNIVEIKHKYRP